MRVRALSAPSPALAPCWLPPPPVPLLLMASACGFPRRLCMVCSDVILPLIFSWASFCQSPAFSALSAGGLGCSCFFEFSLGGPRRFSRIPSSRDFPLFWLLDVLLSCFLAVIWSGGFVDALSVFASTSPVSPRPAGAGLLRDLLCLGTSVSLARRFWCFIFVCTLLWPYVFSSCCFARSTAC